MFEWFLRFQFVFVLNDFVIQCLDIAIYLNLLCLEKFATTLIDRNLTYYDGMNNDATLRNQYYGALQDSLSGVGTVDKNSILFSYEYSFVLISE